MTKLKKIKVKQKVLNYNIRNLFDIYTNFDTKKIYEIHLEEIAVLLADKLGIAPITTYFIQHSEINDNVRVLFKSKVGEFESWVQPSDIKK